MLDKKQYQTLILPWIPAGVVGILAICLSLFVWQQRTERHRQDMAADFAYESREMGLRISEHLSTYRQILRGGRSFLSARGPVSRDEWRGYVGNLFLKHEHPGILGLGIAAKIAKDDLKVHVQRVRENGFPEYQPYPEQEAESYSPVVRLEPLEGKVEPIIGYDLSSQPELAVAMETSALKAQTVLTEPVNFPESLGGGQVLFMFQPIYKPNAKLTVDVSDDKARLDAIHGWVFIAFRMSDLIAEALGAMPTYTRIRVLLKEARNEPAIFDSLGQGHALPIELPPLVQAMEMESDGQSWLMEFSGLPRNHLRQSWWSGELLVVILISVLSVLSAIFVTSMRLHSARLLRMTKELQESEQRYQFMATHDPLTKAANRLMFQTTLATTCAEAQRYNYRFAVIYVDLDKFKAVNDTLGHHYGDLLLLQVTERVTNLLRKSDMLCRNGGDEFIVLLPMIENVSDVHYVAGKILVALSTPFPLEDQVGNISGSLGVAIFPDDAKDMETLIHCADERMYASKKKGGNCCHGSEGHMSQEPAQVASA